MLPCKKGCVGTWAPLHKEGFQCRERTGSLGAFWSLCQRCHDLGSKLFLAGIWCLWALTNAFLNANALVVVLLEEVKN